MAAVLFHLTAQEAQLVEEYPADMILGTAADAPRETVGPFCLECQASYGSTSR